MKPITALLLAMLAAVATSCSDSSADKAGGSSKKDVFPEEQVVAIVNAVNEKDVAKVTTLLQANPKLVRAKFQSGGPVDGWPLVMIAAHKGDKPMVELLIRSGADVNDRNLSNEAPLHYAANGGYKEIVMILIENKADVNVKNDVDSTPLSLASAAGKTDVVALLKEHGAKE